jgi:hypothetical protein
MCRLTNRALSLVAGLVLLLLLATPTIPGVSAEADVAEATRTRLLELVSSLAEIGAEPDGEALFYSDNLWELINGAAEAFHNYEMEALLHQEFMVGEVEITVDLYDMGTPLNAFGIYSAERSPRLNFFRIGTQGYIDDYTLNFLQSRYYVKLSVYGDNGREAAERVARGISAAIGAPGEMPAIFGHFPQEDRVRNSEKLILQSPLGYSFLSPVYEVSYKTGEALSSLLLSEAATPDEAPARLRRLRQVFERSGEVENVEGFGVEAFRASSQYQDNLVCVPAERFLVILMNPQSGWQRLMHETIQLIRDNKSQ